MTWPVKLVEGAEVQEITSWWLRLRKPGVVVGLGGMVCSYCSGADDVD